MNGGNIDQEAQITRERVEFASRTLEAQQCLIRALDTKAEFLMVGAGALFALLVPMITPAGKPLFGVFAVAALISLGFSVGSGIAVILPRGPQVKPPNEALGVLYPGELLVRHPDYRDYKEALTQITNAALLPEYAHQIHQCARVYMLKLRHVRDGVVGFSCGLLCWAAIMILKVLNASF